ncbi:Fic family protein, partial [Campylobacter devanensis]
PSLPIDYEVENYINKILKNDDKKNSAIELMLYIMRNQLFFDGNKRTAMLTANKILIKNGLGIFAVRQQSMQDFFTKLVKFYESGESNEIMLFCKRECIETMNTE